MANYPASTRARIADINVGLRVDKAAISVAGATTKPIFTVTGGRVLVRALVGEATIAITNSTANSKFVSTPSVDGGTATDMCANGQTQDMRIGGMISLPGTSIATAAHVTAATAVGAVPACNTAGIVVAAGSIGFATASDNTGSIKFSIWYVPMDEGAYVTAV